ncbi:MAG: ribosomal L7Ae/L30e/S12e/Gadd45 family protein [Defluviitaleaceae bacterium]|nr:ribosomal L7Ae/L30e/S12e/Gadd45 family protein [Defluviitaleaceae bacterium]
MEDIAIYRKLFSLVSLSMRAGKLITGEEAGIKAIQSGKAKLAFVATDASDNTRKKFSDKSKYYNVPCFCYFTKADIESAIGKTNRASFIIICENFAKQMIVYMENIGIEQYMFVSSK